MAKDTEMSKERAVKQAERVVEETIDQTRGALENYFNLMQKAFSSYPGRNGAS